MILWSHAEAQSESGVGDAADWLATRCRSTNGILTIRPGGRYVSGYFGNIASLGLVAASAHSDVALAWMNWYVAHAHGSGSGIDGVPDDVRVLKDGTIESRGRPDSTDAYGATFLMLARAAYESGEPALAQFVRDHRRDLAAIAESILATQQSSGLTWSRPQHPIAYAIDNEQVYRGLLDGAALMREAFGDETIAAHLESRAARTLSGINVFLWSGRSQSYRPYVDRAQRGPEADLGRAYPDALAQVFGIVYGTLEPRSYRAAELLGRASPALMRPTNGDAAEDRYVDELATRITGAEIGSTQTFAPPPVCADAAWFIFMKIGRL